MHHVSAPKKVTGGSAPRINLQVLQKKKAKAKAASSKPSSKIPVQANSFCVMCRDGGDICLIVSEESMHMVEGPDVKFICVTCHLQQNKKHSKPYFGFYSKGEPTLSTPPTIPKSFQHAIISQVAPLPTALLHLHLEGLDQAIGLAQVAMLHSFLQAYFPQGDYNFFKLPFNLATPESMDEYDKKASHLANTLSAYSRVVLFLTTHSDEERGDLFTGYINDKPVASKVLPFLQLLLTPLSKIINGSDMVFYVCGSVVTNLQSFSEEKEIAQQFTPKSMLLFDAQHLQLASTVPYLHSLLDSTIIQGFPVSSAARVALDDCGMLGRHSKIILLIFQEEGLVVKKFVWTDKHVRPWGHNLPIQCPHCGTIQKWVGGPAGKTVSFECKYSDCGKNMGPDGKSVPPKLQTFSIPENATQLTQGARGTSSWLQITL
ncbi:hypothetical protein EDC04DRAFT_2601242 [Pisolithus marmoratus]|nr:hypothetical protein EDC04DRAFT_2601242 [Pisolithus marmoratus]